MQTILTWVKFFSTLIPDINTRLLHLFWNFQSFMIFSFFLMKLKHVYFVLSLSLSLSLSQYQTGNILCKLHEHFHFYPGTWNSFSVLFCSLSLSQFETNTLTLSLNRALVLFLSLVFILILANSNKCPTRSTSMHFWFSKWISNRMWNNRDWCWSQASLENAKFAERVRHFNISFLRISVVIESNVLLRMYETVTTGWKVI